MKMKLMAMTLLTLAAYSSIARDLNVRVEIPRDQRAIERELRECRLRNDSLLRDLKNTSDLLRSCQLSDRRDDRADRMRIEQLERDNRNLSDHNRYLQTEVDRLLVDNQRLKIEITRLERELYPLPGTFNLAESIRACAEIRNATYSQECSSHAKKYSIIASTISACAKINNAYYANDCVKNAGVNSANTRQVEACTRINNATYASECVIAAGSKRVDADVVNSCVETSTNAYYQLECVKSM